MGVGRSWPGAHGYKPHVVIRQPDNTHRCTRCPFDGDRSGAARHIVANQFTVEDKR